MHFRASIKGSGQVVYIDDQVGQSRFVLDKSVLTVVQFVFEKFTESVDNQSLKDFGEDIQETNRTIISHIRFRTLLKNWYHQSHVESDRKSAGSERLVEND